MSGYIFSGRETHDNRPPNDPPGKTSSHGNADGLPAQQLREAENRKRPFRLFLRRPFPLPMTAYPHPIPPRARAGEGNSHRRTAKPALRTEDATPHRIIRESFGSVGRSSPPQPLPTCRPHIIRRLQASLQRCRACLLSHRKMCRRPAIVSAGQRDRLKNIQCPAPARRLSVSGHDE